MKTPANRRFLPALSLAIGLALAPFGEPSARAANAAAVAEVLKLQSAGLAEETIVAYVQSHNTNYELTADDVVTLRDKGLPTGVLNAMLASGGTTHSTRATSALAVPAAPATPTTPAAPVVQAVPAVPALPAVPGIPTMAAPPPTASPDVAYFYQELSSYGRWVLTEDGQWYWQPQVAIASPNWRPYWDRGRWIYTNDGWYWASEYPWGWAAFHYGRWRLHPHFGWLWMPDRVWAPAWVAWRSGGEYCGWAPLPPGARYDVAAGRFLWRGRRVEAGFDFGLDWMHFNFCYVRDLGETHRWRPANDLELRATFGHTSLVVDDRRRGGPGPHFVNRGIEPARVAQMRGRPVPEVRLEDVRAPLGHGVHERLNEEHHTLEVYRPQFDRRDRRDRH